MDENQSENTRNTALSVEEDSKAIVSPNLQVQEEWKNDVKRLIRRAQIYKQMGLKPSVKEVKDTVREYENRIGVEKLIEALVSEENVVNPTMARVAQKLQDELVKDHPEIRAVVLLGSSVHGGALIRQVTESNKEPDLDWGYNFLPEGR